MSLISHNVGKRKDATAEWIHVRSNINRGVESMKSTGNVHVLRTVFGDSYIYWTVHHCNTWRMEDQIDVTC